MGLKDSTDRRPLRYVISAIITTASVTTGVVGFLMNKRIELNDDRHELAVQELRNEHQQALDEFDREVADSQRQLASVQRDIAGSSMSLDVRSLLMSPQQAVRSLSESEYFGRDRFYARRVDGDAGWAHRVTTELALSAGMQGVTEQQLQQQLSPLQAKAAVAIPVHLWESRQAFHIEGHPHIALLHPHIVVQRAPHRDMQQLFDEAARGTSENSSDHQDEGDEAADDNRSTVEALEHFYRGDQSGLMLTNFLYLETTLGVAGNSPTILNEVHKVGNVVYASLETVLRDVTVNGRAYAEFPLAKEMLIISTPTDLYVVKTTIPTPPDRGPAELAWINGWFVDFGIVSRDAARFDANRTAAGPSRSRVQ